MNFRITIDPPAIYSTGSAIDNASVFGSLKMARAALEDAVNIRVVAIHSVLDKSIAELRADASAKIAALRAARKAALKVRESDLPNDATPSGPA